MVEHLREGTGHRPVAARIRVKAVAANITGIFRHIAAMEVDQQHIMARGGFGDDPVEGLDAASEWDTERGVLWRQQVGETRHVRREYKPADSGAKTIKQCEVVAAEMFDRRSGHIVGAQDQRQKIRPECDGTLGLPVEHTGRTRPADAKVVELKCGDEHTDLIGKDLREANRSFISTQLEKPSLRLSPMAT